MNKVKMAKDIIKDIENRGKISVPDGYVTGEAFEKWLYEDSNYDYTCSAYDKETGFCKEFKKDCDYCYSHYMNIPLSSL
jgi:hypothetical protein